MANTLQLPVIGNWEGHIVRLVNGMSIEVDKRDLVGDHIAYWGAWEKDAVAFVRHYLKPGMVVIDAGTHVGQYSMISSRCVGPSGQVHGFEPHPGLFNVFQRNIKRSDCRNVVSQQLALGKRAEERLLYPSAVNNLGATSFVPAGPECGNPLSVTVIRLDDYVAEHAIEGVDFIKVDVEGAELELLEGAEKTLNENYNIVLMIEFYALNATRFGYTIQVLEHKLRRAGFHLFSINGHGLAPYQDRPELCQNVVAVRKLSILLKNLPEAYAAQSLLGLALKKQDHPASND